MESEGDICHFFEDARTVAGRLPLVSTTLPLLGPYYSGGRILTDQTAPQTLRRSYFVGQSEGKVKVYSEWL